MNMSGKEGGIKKTEEYYYTHTQQTTNPSTKLTGE